MLLWPKGTRWSPGRPSEEEHKVHDELPVHRKAVDEKMPKLVRKASAPTYKIGGRANTQGTRVPRWIVPSNMQRHTRTDKG